MCHGLVDFEGHLSQVASDSTQHISNPDNLFSQNFTYFTDLGYDSWVQTIYKEFIVHSYMHLKRYKLSIKVLLQMNSSSKLNHLCAIFGGCVLTVHLQDKFHLNH